MVFETIAKGVNFFSDLFGAGSDLKEIISKAESLKNANETKYKKISPLIDFLKLVEKNTTGDIKRRVEDFLNKIPGSYNINTDPARLSRLVLLGIQLITAEPNIGVDKPYEHLSRFRTWQHEEVMKKLDSKQIAEQKDTQNIAADILLHAKKARESIKKQMLDLGIEPEGPAATRAFYIYWANSFMPYGNIAASLGLLDPKKDIGKKFIKDRNSTLGIQIDLENEIGDFLEHDAAKHKNDPKFWEEFQSCLAIIYGTNESFNFEETLQDSAQFNSIERIKILGNFAGMLDPVVERRLQDKIKAFKDSDFDLGKLEEFYDLAQEVKFVHKVGEKVPLNPKTDPGLDKLMVSDTTAARKAEEAERIQELREKAKGINI